MTAKIKIAIAGASGYSGQELIKCLKGHPLFEAAALIGRETVLSELDAGIKLAFLCTPNETSLEMAPQLLKKGISVIDVSGAFRLKKFSYKDWYGFDHNSPEWLKKSEYALFPWKKPQVLKSGEARLIANPGCFPTSVLMALLPALKSGLINHEIISIDSKSGTTGAGRKADVSLLFSEIYGNFAPYKLGKHQHWPEIVEAVENFSGLKINPIFVTELLPLDRGISSALFLRWNERNARDPERLSKLVSHIKETYQGCPDIKIGDNSELLSLKAVCGSNQVRISVFEIYGQPLIVSVIDNLVRGAAGQALMNANLLFGISPFQNLENTLKPEQDGAKQ